LGLQQQLRHIQTVKNTTHLRIQMNK